MTWYWWGAVVLGAWCGLDVLFVVALCRASAARRARVLVDDRDLAVSA